MTYILYIVGAVVCFYIANSVSDKWIKMLMGAIAVFPLINIAVASLFLIIGVVYVAHNWLNGSSSK